jgi:hypothetical protein
LSRAIEEASAYISGGSCGPTGLAPKSTRPGASPPTSRATVSTSAFTVIGVPVPTLYTATGRGNFDEPASSSARTWSDT